jgi:hypothetical protein
MRKATEFYVTIKSWPHAGEKAVVTNEKRATPQGEVEVKTYLLDCIHGNHELWITRDDI